MSFIQKLFSKYKKEKTTPCTATGCKSSKSCLHMNLGKANNAGKGVDATFCAHYNDFVARRDNCQYFTPRGCANGMCNYASHSNGRVYCSRYQLNLIPKESCPAYLDFFDTEEGNDIFAALR